jgi:hypothetical protein
MRDSEVDIQLVEDECPSLGKELQVKSQVVKRNKPTTSSVV